MIYAGDAIAIRLDRHMLRIERSEDRERVVFTLSGRLGCEHEGQLEGLIEAETGRRVCLDLRDVNRVDREAVMFLARCEADGVELANCSAFVRAWILRERGRA
jgi:hypothetical protein